MNGSLDKLNQMQRQLEADLTKLSPDDRVLPTVLIGRVRIVALAIGGIGVSEEFGTPKDVAEAKRQLEDSIPPLGRILHDLKGFCP